MRIILSIGIGLAILLFCSCAQIKPIPASCTVTNGVRECPHPSGKAITWYENGRKATEGYYWGNCKQGRWVEWYENGRVHRAGNYKNDVKVGKWITYWEDGAIEKTEEFDAGR